jgi:UDP-glucose 4-epimerase
LRAFLTGASGQLGASLAALLVRHGEEVAVMARPTSDLTCLEGIEGEVSVFRGDMAELSTVAEQIAAWRPDVAFHVGWQGVGAKERNHPTQLTVNLAGSLMLWGHLAASGCRTWIGVGSQAEYGPQRGVLTEALSPDPQTLYGVAKLGVGQYTQRLAAVAGIRHVWLRLLATYGPRDNPGHLIPSVIRQLLAGERPALTLGEQIVDYLFVEDAAAALYRAAVSPTVQGTYNLASGRPVTIRALVEQARDLIDPALPLGWGEIPYRPDQVMRLEADVQALRTAAGWGPQVDLVDGLRMTIDWYKNHAE